jgi:hypothetical protein
MHSVLLAGNTIHYCRLISYMYTIIVLSLVLIVTSVSSALSPLRTSSHSRLFPNPRHGVENERLRSESLGRIVRPLHDCSTVHRGWYKDCTASDVDGGHRDGAAGLRNRSLTKRRRRAAEGLCSALPRKCTPRRRGRRNSIPVGGCT